METQVFKSLKKICSPKTKHARNAEGRLVNQVAVAPKTPNFLIGESKKVIVINHFRFLEQQTFLSSSNTLTVHFRRTIFTQQKSESEYVDGAYSFLDGKVAAL